MDSDIIFEFDKNSFCSMPKILIVGKNKKSEIVNDILQYFSNDVPVGILISKEKTFSSTVNIPDMFVHHNYKSEIIERVLQRQIMMIRKKNENKNKNINTRAFIVWDLDEIKNLNKDKNFLELIFNGRNYYLMNIFTTNSNKIYEPETRCNFEYIILLRDDSIDSQKKIFRQYGVMFQTFEEFRKVFLDLTFKYGAMIIVNRGIRNSLQEKIFYYDINKIIKLIKQNLI
jgi:hypothetical protein